MADPKNPVPSREGRDVYTKRTEIAQGHSNMHMWMSESKSVSLFTILALSV